MRDRRAGFPIIDPVGPSAGLADDDLVRDAARVAETVLVPGAASADRDGIPRSTITSLGPLLGMAAPDSPASPAQWREVSETLMAADGTAWFCWSQHHPLVRAISGALPYAGEYAAHLVALREDLVRGRTIASVSFSHLRRPGPPAVTARRHPDGWILQGRVDWITAWDICDVVLLMAESDGEFVSFVLDATPQPGLCIEPPLDLMAMSGSHTRPIAFDGLVIPHHRLVGRQPAGAWHAIDEQITIQPNPAAFGLARGALGALASAGQERSCQETIDVAYALAEEVRALRSRTYAAVDDGADRAYLLDLRAQGLALAARTAAAAITGGGGRSMVRGSDSERRYREAAFLLVQRQTALTRAASLDAWLSRGPMPHGVQPAHSRG